MKKLLLIAFLFFLFMGIFNTPLFACSSTLHISPTGSVCEGSRVEFTFSGSDYYHLYGAVSGSPIVAVTGSLVVVHPTDTLFLMLVGHDTLGSWDELSCTDTVYFQVNVLGVPDLTVSASGSLSPCEGDSSGVVTLSASSGFVAYYWTDQFSGDTIGSGQSVEVTGFGPFVCWATTSGGCSSYAVFDVDTPQVGLFVVLEVAFPDSLHPTCYPFPNLESGGGVEPVEYHFYFEGVEVTAFSDTLGSGTYKVVAIDSTGCSDSASCVLTIPTVPVAMAGADKFILVGQSDSIGTAATDTVSRYQWFPVVGLSDSSAAMPFASPMVTTTYTLVMLHDWCLTVDSMTVFVTNPIPDVEAVNGSFYYTENKGQMVDDTGAVRSDIQYSNSQTGVWLMGTKFSYSAIQRDSADTTMVHKERIDMAFAAPDAAAKIAKPFNKQVPYNNYFLAHCPDGVTNVKNYGSVVYEDVFPSIDYYFSSNSAGMKQYIVVNEGGDPDDIDFTVSGAQSVYVDGNNDLVLQGAVRNVVIPKPKAFQVENGNWTELESFPEFTVTGNHVKFSVGSYDTGKKLFLKMGKDEAAAASFQNKNMQWSTFWGGSGDEIFFSVTNDSQNNTYICGGSQSLVFPHGSGSVTINDSVAGGMDVIAIKVNSFAVPVWYTYYGGTNYDYGTKILLNHSNNIIIVGNSTSNDFPCHSHTGSYFNDVCNPGSSDGIFLKLNNSGNSVIWATYFGVPDPPADINQSKGAAINSNGDLYVGGICNGQTPLQNETNAAFTDYQTGKSFYCKFNANDSLVWSIKFPGFINSVAADNDGNTFITGYTDQDGFGFHSVLPGGNPAISGQFGGAVDGFVTMFNSSDQVHWSTFLGGNGDDRCTDIAVDKLGYCYVTGSTKSNNFPMVSPSSANGFLDNTPQVSPTSTDAFIARFVARSNEFDTLTWSSYFSGIGEDIGTALAIDDSNRVFLGGHTSGQIPFPNINAWNYWVQDYKGPIDGFIAYFDKDLHLFWTTYYGGNGDYSNWGKDYILDMSVYNSNDLYIVGKTFGSAGDEFPLWDYSSSGSDYYQTSVANAPTKLDGFIGRFNLPYLILGIEPTTNELYETNLYPNPTNNIVNISFNIYDCSDVIIQVFDMKGQNIIKNNYSNLQGQNNISINTLGLSRGIYLVKLLAGSKQITKKLIIQ